MINGQLIVNIIWIIAKNLRKSRKMSVLDSPSTTQDRSNNILRVNEVNREAEWFSTLLRQAQDRSNNNHSIWVLNILEQYSSSNPA